MKKLFLLLVLLATPGFAQVSTFPPQDPTANPFLTGSQITAPTGCTTPPYGFTADADAGLCLVGANAVRLQSAPITTVSSGLVEANSSGIVNNFYDAAGLLNTLTVGTDLISLGTHAVTRLSLTTTTLSSTLPIVLPNGTRAAPALSTSDTSKSGIFWSGSADSTVTNLYSQNGNTCFVDSTPTCQVAVSPSTTGVRLAPTIPLGWVASGAANSGASDTILVRDNAANTLALRNGGTAGAPVPQTFNVYNFCDGAACATGYERLAMYWTANQARLETFSAGTGTARDVVISDAQANRVILLTAGTGTPTSSLTVDGANSAVKMSASQLTGAKSTALSDNTKKAFAVVAVPSDSYVGGDVIWTLYCADANDRVARSGRIPFSAINDGGTETCSLGTSSNSGDAGGTTGPPTFVAITFTCADGGTNAIQLEVQADCSLTPTTLTIEWRIDAPRATATGVTPQS